MLRHPRKRKPAIKAQAQTCLRVLPCPWRFADSCGHSAARAATLTDE